MKVAEVTDYLYLIAYHIIPDISDYYAISFTHLLNADRTRTMILPDYKPGGLYRLCINPHLIIYTNTQYPTTSTPYQHRHQPPASLHFTCYTDIFAITLTIYHLHYSTYTATSLYRQYTLAVYIHYAISTWSTYLLYTYLHNHRPPVAITDISIGNTDATQQQMITDQMQIDRCTDKWRYDADDHIFMPD